MRQDYANKAWLNRQAPIARWQVLAACLAFMLAHLDW